MEYIKKEWTNLTKNKISRIKLYVSREDKAKSSNLFSYSDKGFPNAIPNS